MATIWKYKIIVPLLTLLAIAFLSTPVLAQKKPKTASVKKDHPFKAGKKNASFGMSLQSNFGNTYFVVNAGFGIFVLDGLETSLEGAYWIGSPPAIGQISPGIKYTFFQVPSFHPYLGAFYRRWFIGDNIPDTDTVGARGGISYRQNNAVFSVGVMYERIISDCVEDCVTIVPELKFSLSL